MASQKVTKISLAEIYKRVPPNQIQKFLHFRDKNAQYKKRVNKYPEFLPKIDWDYYRCNVRSEYVKMVDEFEKKYEELNNTFDCRHQLDTSMYFKDVDKQRVAVKSEVQAYIAESNKRIKLYEASIQRIKALLPYDQMTCEEFVMACPDKAALIGRGDQPTFWPHIPEEQTPGPANPQAHEELERLLETGEPEPETEPTQKDASPAAGVGTKAATSATTATQAIKPAIAEEAKKVAASVDAAKQVAQKEAKKAATELDAAVAEAKKAAAELDAETAKQAKTLEAEAAKEATKPKQPTKPENSSEETKGKKPDDKGKK